MLKKIFTESILLDLLCVSVAIHSGFVEPYYTFDYRNYDAIGPVGMNMMFVLATVCFRLEMYRPIRTSYTLLVKAFLILQLSMLDATKANVEDIC